MAKYLILKKIEILKANANPVWYLVGSPALTAFHGFIQALLLNMANGTNGVDEVKKLVLHEGFAVVHREIQMLGSWNTYKTLFLPNQISSAHAYDKNDYVKSTTKLASQPTATCNLLVDLVIKLPEGLKVEMDKIKSFLYGGKIAGGQINIAKLDMNTQVVITDSYANIKKHIKNGFYIIDRHDLLKKQDEKNALELLLNKTQRRKNSDENKEWLVPNSVGYLCLTNFEKTENSRNGNEVAYAEPLVTLTEYRSVRKTEGIPFWKWTQEVTNTGKNLFKLTGDIK